MEERANYDLVIAEFDDEGWYQGEDRNAHPTRDFMDHFIARLNHYQQQYQQQGISLVVYVHGWTHNAAANDSNVRNFRALLNTIAEAEGANGRRTIGVYIGWRGDAISLPGIEMLSFWNRMSAAERVAQGSVRELFSWLHAWRDSGRNEAGERKIRMLVIGHSFGGLIAWRAMSGEFLRAASRYSNALSADSCEQRKFLSRYGDLLVLVNPAFEGSIYEPIKVAAERLKCLSRYQFPLVLTITSSADLATGIAFPLGRLAPTLLRKVSDQQRLATLKTVGHNSRYTTHKLSLCAQDDLSCLRVCNSPGTLLQRESQRMTEIVQRGIHRHEYLCSRLELVATPQWRPEMNPFWVIQTSHDISRDHNDIFNPKLMSFVRQMYIGLIDITEKEAKKASNNHVVITSATEN
ncbi:hypothetical protein J2125_001227 [Erwinia toletana]|uniref:Uncharacterized protein n=1 Tax=Winslowiella toletana TaxID=92490 RepID=A0ABS4P5W2_9GAMM|nr:hypothetical protein [Winslowiella toletana]MBP2168035.1 hypothetical protein [Winslowiella toletana]